VKIRVVHSVAPKASVSIRVVNLEAFDVHSRLTASAKPIWL